MLPVAMLAMFCTAQVADGALVLDFTNSVAQFNGGDTYSNLVETSSLATPLTIRWGFIANNGATDIDLVATHTGGTYRANDVNPNPGGSPPQAYLDAAPYAPSGGFDNKVWLNGLQPLTSSGFRYGRINLGSDHASTFTFTLVTTGGDVGFDDVSADFAFSVLDIDTGNPPAASITPAGQRESVQLTANNGTATWVTQPGTTELLSTYTPTSPAANWTAPAITPTQPIFVAGPPYSNVPNPTDPFNLTLAQKNRIVKFQFENTSTFDLRLTVDPSANADDIGGRNFLFTGASAVAVVPEPASVSLVAVCGLGLLLTRRKKKCQSAAGIDTES